MKIAKIGSANLWIGKGGGVRLVVCDEGRGEKREGGAREAEGGDGRWKGEGRGER